MFKKGTPADSQQEMNEETQAPCSDSGVVAEFVLGGFSMHVHIFEITQPYTLRCRLPTTLHMYISVQSVHIILYA